MLSIRDLQDLENAAKIIVNIIERNHVHEEDAAERRASLKMETNVIPFPVKRIEPAVTKKTPTVGTVDETSKIENAFDLFTEKEMNQMSKQFKKVYLVARKRCRVRIKDNGSYELRFRSGGYNLSACGKTVELAKSRMLEKISKATKSESTSKKPTFPTTFKEFALYYCERFRKPKVVKSTWVKDMIRLKKYLFPFFGSMKIKNITPFECQNLFNDILARGYEKTLGEVRCLLNILLKGAIAHNIIDFNPLNVIPYQMHERNHGKALSRAEEEKLFAELPAKMKRPIALLLYCGLRPNELLTVNIEAEFVIAKNSKRKNRRVEYKRIPICKKLKQYLPMESSIVRIQTLRDAFNAILPGHRLYDLRTTFYTRCQELNVAPAARDEFVGHSLGILGNTYTDLSDEYLLSEGKKLDLW